MGINLNGPSADHRNWGPGWPHNNVHDCISVSGGGVTVLMHKDIAELVGLLLDETLRRGYVMDKGPHDDWGFAGRYIAGTTTPSNHSWGLAIDINANHNPYGSHLVTDMPHWMPDLWNEFGFRWGGDYSGNKDAMHYEFMGTPQDAKDMLAKAKKQFGGAGDDDMYEKFKQGWKLFTDGKELPKKADPDVTFGWNAARFAANNPPAGSGGGPAPLPEHTHVPGAVAKK